jgi:phosphodiesterase/alkaline phosphatase D-like protein
MLRLSKGTAIGGLSMHRLLLKLALTATVGSLLFSTPTVAQILPPAKKAERVEITQGPALESARDGLTIIRWTTNNPGGTDVHFGVVYYGTDPTDLSQMAKSPITVNRGHAETTFRVRMPGLKPQTTYYYTVTSMESNGKSDGVESPVTQFTTPSPGERIVAYPPQPARPR